MTQAYPYGKRMDGQVATLSVTTEFHRSQSGRERP